ncbi:hypothetical protein CXB51_014471 [Gossypium anomalum]|uniref:Uncharacterized protein n=1 Tax=Gossypium anomalum TaxID=47600 RepID=A0A8J5Z4L6_9ROSI|nr:hypothetical protein CXB51_014471 [Gossypium anomalum]
MGFQQLEQVFKKHSKVTPPDLAITSRSGLGCYKIGLTYHDPLIATIGDDLVALAIQQQLVCYYSTKVPMPPFGHDISLNVPIANLELPIFEAFSKVLLKPNSSGHYSLGPAESNSPASDFSRNLLRFFGGANNSHGTISSREMGPFDEKH